MLSSTGNKDIDVTIITSLNLQDLRRICQIDQYTLKLCKNDIVIKHKINQAEKNVNNTLDTLYKSKQVAIKPKYELNFDDLYNLLSKLKINSKSNLIDFKNRTLHSIRFYYRNDKLLMQIFFPVEIQGYNHYIALFVPNIDQIQELLMNLYYDDLL
jgi:hypothetical protein